MREVFLLGAGFSRAVAPQMPLLRELSKLVFEQRAGLDDVDADFNYADHRVAFGDDFELRLTYLAEDQPWLSVAENLRNHADYRTAAKQMATILRQRQNEVVRAGSQPWLQRLVSSWHAKRSTILTLNYDTLIEKTFEMEVRQARRQIYPVPITNIIARTGSGVFGGPPIETMELLKLHGSISWQYSGAADFYGEPIYDASKFAWTEEHENDEPMLLAADKTPLVIPPTWGKTVFFNNEVVRGQWVRGFRALRQKDTILYCIGYSLPATDHMMRFFLTSGLRDLRIRLINTDPNVVAHYQRELAFLPPDPN